MARTAESEILAAAGILASDAERLGAPARSVTIDYLNTLGFQDDLLHLAWIDHVGRSSIRFTHQIWCSDELAVTAFCTHVVVNENGEPTAIGPAFGHHPRVAVHEPPQLGYNSYRAGSPGQPQRVSADAAGGPSSEPAGDIGMRQRVEAPRSRVRSSSSIERTAGPQRSREIVFFLWHGGLSSDTDDEGTGGIPGGAAGEQADTATPGT